MGEKLTCYICNKENNEGIVILNRYICRSCELEMMDISYNELKFEGIRRKIKNIWKGVSLNTEKHSTG